MPHNNSKILLNRFSSIQVSDEAHLRGSIFTAENLDVLQNHLAEAALTKNSLDLDPNDVLPYVQQESYNTGKIELLEFLIENHDASQTALLELKTNQRDGET